MSLTVHPLVVDGRTAQGSSKQAAGQVMQSNGISAVKPAESESMLSDALPSNLCIAAEACLFAANGLCTVWQLRQAGCCSPSHGMPFGAGQQLVGQCGFACSGTAAAPWSQWVSQVQVLLPRSLGECTLKNQRSISASLAATNPQSTPVPVYITMHMPMNSARHRVPRE